MKPTLALSIRQPWPFLMLCGLPGAKDLENRDWRTSYRGRIYVHAAKGMTQEDYDAAVEFAANIRPNIVIPKPEDLPRGGIVGEVDIIDCVENSLSDWFVGKYGFLLGNPYRYESIIPCKGMPGFFKPVFPI